MSVATATGQKAWVKAIPNPAANEFAATELSILEGAIPAGLRGTLYRNGPGRLERGRDRAAHWFDGDGAILRVQFNDDGATGTFRFVQTAGYLAEAEANKLLFNGYGTLIKGPIWKRLSISVKNTANTSVLALPDKLLALWEAGPPHALDLESLETLGVELLDELQENSPYSAHPKRDPLTGEIYNFGVSFGTRGTLNLYRSERSGRILKRNAIALQGLPMIHDFMIAGPYLVFFISPVYLNGLAVLTGKKGYSDALEWQPQKGTQILVVDRESLEEVSHGQAEPWFQWHYGNGFVDTDGSVVVDLARYEDFQTNQYLSEVVLGRTVTNAKSAYWRVRIDPKSGRVQETHTILDRICDFPVVAPDRVGQSYRHAYLSVHGPDADYPSEYFGSIARVDVETGDTDIATAGKNRYPMEPIYAPDVLNSEQGWVVTVVFDGDCESSEVWIYDREGLADGPVCKLALPDVVPLGFHGKWHPAA
ncbi:MAG: carotenoid oxygenase family protein [Cyanobacteria bacterium P01_D01_bin.123]